MRLFYLVDHSNSVNLILTLFKQRIDIFVPFAANLGFVISMERFRERLNLTSGHHLRPHLALISAILLWASHISKIPDLRQHTNIFLQRAILQLQSILNATSRNEVSMFT